MNRNDYDGDTTTFSPQGRIHQVEYAMEAVKQGSTAVACVGGKEGWAVVAAIKVKKFYNHRMRREEEGRRDKLGGDVYAECMQSVGGSGRKGR